MDMSLHEEFFNHLTKKGYSQNYVAIQLGFSGATISFYKSKSYEGDVEKLEHQIKRWLEEEKRKEEMLNIPIIIHLSTIKQVYRAIDNAKDRKNISVVTGDAGCGKTEAARHYVNYSSQAILVEVGPIVTRKSLLNELARCMDLETKGSLDMIVLNIVEKLKDTGKVIIIDEADRLDYGKLDILRRISDQARCGLVLIAISKFKYELENKHNDYDQLSSRCGPAFNLNEIIGSVDINKDITSILKHTKLDYDSEVITTLYNKCGGSLRKICDVLMTAYELMTRYKEIKLTSNLILSAFNVKL